MRIMRTHCTTTDPLTLFAALPVCCVQPYDKVSPHRGLLRFWHHSSRKQRSSLLKGDLSASTILKVPKVTWGFVHQRKIKDNEESTTPEHRSLVHSVLVPRLGHVTRSYSHKVCWQGAGDWKEAEYILDNSGLWPSCRENPKQLHLDNGRVYTKPWVHFWIWQFPGSPRRWNMQHATWGL